MRARPVGLPPVVKICQRVVGLGPVNFLKIFLDFLSGSIIVLLMKMILFFAGLSLLAGCCTPPPPQKYPLILEEGVQDGTPYIIVQRVDGTRYLKYTLPSGKVDWTEL